MIAAMKSRRGVTIAEIVVALALVSIMIVMAVSFTALITQRTRASAEGETLRQDRSMLESGVERWLDAVTLGNAALSSDSTRVTAQIGGQPYILTFSAGSLAGQLPTGQSVFIRTEYTVSVSFEMMTQGNDLLLFCTVNSYLPHSEKDVAYTFCVNSHIGELGGSL